MTHLLQIVNITELDNATIRKILYNYVHYDFIR